MKTYDCLVRLDAAYGREVPKYGVTAAEITLIRELHGARGGAEPVVKIRESETTPVTHAGETEYERLCRNYSAKDVERVFGPPVSARLPDELTVLEMADPERPPMKTVGEMRHAPKRGRPRKSEPEALSA